MRILWIKTELLHPVDKGGRIRTYQMLKALARQHQVTYLCLDDGNAHPQAQELAAEYCQQLITVRFAPPPKSSLFYLSALFGNLFSSLPYAVQRYRSGELSLQIDQCAKHADVVICDFLTPSVNVSNQVASAAVMFQHNVEAAIWQRHATVPQNWLRKKYLTLQWQRMKSFEALECRRFRRVVAVSESDQETFERDYGVRDVRSIATGVDLEYFSPQPSVQRKPHELVFIGSMDWLPNDDGIRWFVEHVWPHLQSQIPDVHLTIVGRSPSVSLRRLAATRVGITITGSVPDVRPFLNQASISVVPLRIGGGTRLKIYEAMSMAVPVVATTIGAEGLPLVDGDHILIADDPAAQVNAIVALLSAPAKARKMAEAARNYVRNHFGWETVAAQFLQSCR